MEEQFEDKFIFINSVQFLTLPQVMPDRKIFKSNCDNYVVARINDTSPN